MKRIVLIALLMLAGRCWAQIQYPYILNPPTVAPSGSCAGPQIQVLGSNGHVYTCNNGTWADLTAGVGTGNVTGPGSSIAHDVVSYADTTGIVLEDPAGQPNISNSHILANGFWSRMSHDDKMEIWFCYGASPWTGSILNSAAGSSVATTATGLDQNHMCASNVISGTTINAGEGLQPNPSGINTFVGITGSNPWFMVSDVYLSTLTTAAYYFGFAATYSSVMSNGTAIFFDSTVSATNWQCKWNTTVTDSGVAAAATTWANLAITSDGTTVKYYIGGTQVCSVAIGSIGSSGTPEFQSIARAGSASVTLTVNDFLFYRKATK